jgi:hypothetical protein
MLPRYSIVKVVSTVITGSIMVGGESPPAWLTNEICIYQGVLRDPGKKQITILMLRSPIDDRLLARP